MVSSPSHPLPQFLIARMRVDGRRQRAHVPRESLREEQVPRSTVNVRDRRVPQGVQRVEVVEPCLHLLGPERELDAAWRDASAALAAEERVLSP